MKKPCNRKNRPMFGPFVAPFPHRRDMGMIAGALLTAASISSPAVAVSPAPPPPEIFAAPQTGDGLWAVCGGSSFGRIPLACSAYVAGTSDGVALTTVSGRPFCVTPQIQPEDLAQAVRLYIAAHPESRSRSAASVVAVALRDAYPCRLAEQRR
jgi:hypothetical protein